jgi:hypothetical protein
VVLKNADITMVTRAARLAKIEGRGSGAFVVNCAVAVYRKLIRPRNLAMRDRLSEQKDRVMNRVFVCVALAALTMACGQQADTRLPPATTSEATREPDAIIPTDPTAGPSGTDNMTWRFDPAGSATAGTPLPRLMYASNGSEGMALNLQCESDTVHARLWRGEQRANWPFSLQSGAIRTDLSGTGQGESEVVVTATLPLNSPVLDAFRRSGVISLVEDGRTQVLDAINEQERQAISSFFQACS